LLIDSQNYGGPGSGVVWHWWSILLNFYEAEVNMDIADETKFVEAIAGKVAAKLKTESSDENREFLLHLYDALWENTRSKENRLWTFLSLYGAAVALVFAGGEASQAPGADLLAIAIVTALSTWAVLIIINANWWYYRNQLMVSRIEAKYPEAVKGLVPKAYFQDPNFKFDQLYKGSILLLSLLLFLLYSRTIWSYHGPGTINSLQALSVVTLVYLVFVLSAGYCLRQHEANIETYYSAKRNLLEDASAPSELPVQDRLKVLDDELKARRKNDVRIYVFLLLILVGGVFDFIIWRNGVGFGWLAAIAILQSMAAIIFWVQAHLYRQPYSAKDRQAIDTLENANPHGPESLAKLAILEDKLKLREMNDKSHRLFHASWHLVLLLSVSGIIAIWPLYRSNEKLQDDWRGAKSVSVSDLSQKLNKVQEDFQSAQASFNQLQQSNLHLQKQLLDEKLGPYQQRQEAEQRFVTREEFNRFVTSQNKTKPVRTGR
jgi:hypothetical protein